MTINYSGINVNYPVAGQDNDSQGFRNNFSTIYTAFQQADIAISSLTNTTVKLNATNDLGGSIISHAVMQNNAEQYFLNPAVDGALYTVYANQASYHDLAITTSTTFQVDGWPNNTNWPSNLYHSKVQVQITPDTSTAFIGFNVDFQTVLPGGTVHYNTATITSLPYISKSPDSQVWELWTNNGGQDVYVNLIGTFAVRT
jgi:hypothetical protein